MVRSGSLLLRRSVACALAFSALARLGSAHADPLAIGAVEKLEAKSSSIVVLGQRYQVGPKTLVVSESSNHAHLALSALTHDSVVWIDGQLLPNGGTRVDTVTILPEQYVPGSTQILVSGIITAVRSDGHVRLGELNVDVTPTFSSGITEFSVGDSIQAYGTQPVAQGVFLAQSLKRSPGQGNSSSQGVGGTGAAGVGGTGAAGVGGTGAAGVGGTGAAGVGGTGAAGVGGTGKSGVGGTGAAGVGGTGAAGVGGTGAAGVGGTGKSGVGGTGAAGVGGTGAN